MVLHDVSVRTINSSLDIKGRFAQSLVLFEKFFDQNSSI